MKKVTLLGDSIRQIGYGAKVAEMLAGEYGVFQPEDNCRFAKYTLRMLFDLKEQIAGSDVIHWNNGHWDLCQIFDDKKTFSSIDEYVDNMVRIASILKTLGKRVIFATTTPVRYEHPYNDNAVIKQFNEAVAPKLKEMGVEINDLHSLVSQDIYRYICEDEIHLSKDGIELCAKQVVKAIKNA